MSPEQAAGHTRDVSTATDVYGLGAILYELLTGRPPFGSGSMAVTLVRILQEEPERPSHLVPDCPRDLETICERFLGALPIQARPLPTWKRAAKWVWRRPTVALAVASLATAAALGAALLYLLLR
jgi:serine/threonine-protein kinase